MPVKYYIFIPKSILKSMAKIPLPWAFRINKILDALLCDPYLGEKMDGKLENRRKIRVWPYRIMYTIDEKIKFIKIVEIEHRGHTSYD
jgi:mRNA-degrading endonuclease RelE of RelBE toxin-antitoxin system